MTNECLGGAPVELRVVYGRRALGQQLRPSQITPEAIGYTELIITLITLINYLTLINYVNYVEHVNYLNYVRGAPSRARAPTA